MFKPGLTREEMGHVILITLLCKTLPWHEPENLSTLVNVIPDNYRGRTLF